MQIFQFSGYISLESTVMELQFYKHTTKDEHDTKNQIKNDRNTYQVRSIWNYIHACLPIFILVSH